MLIAAAFHKHRRFTVFKSLCSFGNICFTSHAIILSSNNYANIAALFFEIEAILFWSKTLNSLLLTKYESMWWPVSVSGRTLALCPCQTSTLRATFFNSLCLWKTRHLPTFHCCILQKYSVPVSTVSTKIPVVHLQTVADAVMSLLHSPNVLRFYNSALIDSLFP